MSQKESRGDTDGWGTALLRDGFGGISYWLNPSGHAVAVGSS